MIIIIEFNKKTKKKYKFFAFKISIFIYKVNTTIHFKAIIQKKIFKIYLINLLNLLTR